MIVGYFVIGFILYLSKSFVNNCVAFVMSLCAVFVQELAVIIIPNQVIYSLFPFIFGVGITNLNEPPSSFCFLHIRHVSVTIVIQLQLITFKACNFNCTCNWTNVIGIWQLQAILYIIIHGYFTYLQFPLSTFPCSLGPR